MTRPAAYYQVPFFVTQDTTGPPWTEIYSSSGRSFNDNNKEGADPKRYTYFRKKALDEVNLSNATTIFGTDARLLVVCCNQSKFVRFSPGGVVHLMSPAGGTIEIGASPSYNN